MKNVLNLLAAVLLIISSCKDKGTITAPVTTQNNPATLSAIALGDEKFNVAVPAEGGTTTVVHAPRTISSILSAVPVTLTAAANATFKIGGTDFTSGQPANFSNGAVTIVVTAEDGKATQSYTVAVTTYNAESNPYGVYTAAHLNDVRNDKAGSYLMKNNITLPARNEAGKAATGITDYDTRGWLPIAHDATFDGLSLRSQSLTGHDGIARGASFADVPITGGFTGIFDGGKFSIDNFYINRDTKYTGLFGVASGATIQNLGVTGMASPAVTGSKYVGALAGYIQQGSISNCYASAGVSLTNSSGRALYAGGLLGVSRGVTISNSYSSGNISVSVDKCVLAVGGFGGMIDYGTISNCFATGNVTASSTAVVFGSGLAGQFYPTTATNCYATGNVTATAQVYSYLGGLGGGVSEISTYTNCYRNSDAAITKSGEGVVDADGSFTGITARTRAQMQSDAFTILLGTSVWGRDGSKNDGLPYIKGVGVGK